MQSSTLGVAANAGKPSPLRGRISARTRFAIAGLALALAIAVGAPAIARALGVGVEAGIFALTALIAVGIGYRTGRAFDRLELRSLEDPVTRVGNRRHGEEQLAEEVDRAIGSSMPLSLLLVDVDDLKKLNDAHGHACGDRALALVGDVLLDTCRSRDVPARFGGDEFAVVLPRTRSGEAKVVAERIRSELARRRALECGPLAALLSVSIGVADLDSASERTPEKLVEAADQALYAAKTGGRDRVEVKEPPRVSGVIRLDEVRAARNKGHAV
jgi:diguanylate cyclase (GGDEF)-like protein